MKQLNDKPIFKEEDTIVMGTNGSAILPGIKAVATVGTPSRDFIKESDDDPQEFNYQGKKYRGVAKWGEDNDLPQQILAKVEKSEILSSGLYFNAFAGYGNGVLPCYVDWTNGGERIVKPYEFRGIELKKKIRDLELQQIELEEGEQNRLNKRKLELVKLDLEELRADYSRWERTNRELKRFTQENDLNHFVDEQLIDLNYFFLAVPELVLNRQNKVTHIVHREAAFSRWEVKNSEGQIENHFYWNKWEDELFPNNYDEENKPIVTPVLDARFPLRDLKIKVGMIRDQQGEKKHHGKFRYILPIPMPSPGRMYYPKSPWYSVFLSGWYDLATKIPEAKNAIIDNSMVLNYHIELSEDYFPDIFKEENITSVKDKKARIQKEYNKLNNFLSGKENQGKSVISYVTYSPEGNEKRKMKINIIQNHLTKEGGQYIEDSEEAGNIQSYAMWVHPSLIGASPGKNKSINGTEARELFIIKQSMQNPFRDRVLKPLYIAKNINGWDENLEWLIPNLELTTLDKDKSGSTVKTQ